MLIELDTDKKRVLLMALAKGCIESDILTDWIGNKTKIDVSKLTDEQLDVLSKIEIVSNEN